MPAMTSWIVPGHVLRISLIENVTLHELNIMRREIQAALKSASCVHYMIDLQKLQRLHDVEGLRYILGKSSSLRNRKIGRVAVLGATQEGQLIFNSAATALHLTLSCFDEEDGALMFLAEAD